MEVRVGLAGVSPQSSRCVMLGPGARGEARLLSREVRSHGSFFANWAPTTLPTACRGGSRCSFDCWTNTAGTVTRPSRTGQGGLLGSMFGAHRRYQQRGQDEGTAIHNNPLGDVWPDDEERENDHYPEDCASWPRHPREVHAKETRDNQESAQRELFTKSDNRDVIPLINSP